MLDYREPVVGITRDQLNRFIAFRCPKSPVNLGAKIWDACLETDINPGILACIGMAKSKNFQLLNDVFACHVEGTLEEQVVNATIQYTHMKPEDLMLPQILWTEIELKHMGMLAWCRNSPEPKPVPKPVPEPKPVPKPEPKPVPEPKPEKKKNLPDWLVKFSMWFGIISGAVATISWFYPPLKVAIPVIQFIKMLLAALSTS